MKKKVSKNSNGIVICDSIIMSVKKKHMNLRCAESVFIALIGYVSAVMSFLSMFHFRYDRPACILAAIVFSGLYITLSLMGRKGLWIIGATVLPAIFISARFIDTLALGYKYTYNTIYKAAFHTEIAYYKFLKPDNEKAAVTAFFIFCLWLTAVAVYTFTINRPNSIPPLLVTFPMIEVGLYNGMEVSIFWGMLLVGYWLAVFAMTAIDIGEYSGGSSGFVRKEDLFFPKRQMRLKVTEKCGIAIIAEVLVITVISCLMMKMTGYKRSDELNRKRIQVRDAVNAFSIDNFAESVTNITNAFGFSFKYESHTLGNVDRLKYKNTHDLTVTVSDKIDGSLYLKEYTGSVYDTDKWSPLPVTVYDSDMFTEFAKYSFHPQDLPNDANCIIGSDDELTVKIKSNLKNNRSFAPYGTDKLGLSSYNHDSDVSSKKQSENTFSYRFTPVVFSDVARKVTEPMRYTFTSAYISDPDWQTKLISYCSTNGLLSRGEFFNIDSELPAKADYLYENPDKIMSMLLQDKYEDFVYENYLLLPNTAEISEVRSSYSQYLGYDSRNMTAAEKLALLDRLRAEVASNVTYTLNPGRTPNNRDFVNYFLLENKKGYCTHYATAGVVLARMAGIPARYATGYVIVGNDFNDSNKSSDGSYNIKVMDNRSHAWIEVYLSGYGWVPYEFTAGYSDQSIETTPATTTTESTAAQTTTTAAESQTTTSSSDEGSKTTRSKSSSKSDSTTTAASTTVTTTAAVVAVKKEFHLSAEAKQVLFILMIAALSVAAVIVRRILILNLMKKRFTTGDPTMRIRYIFGYIEKLMGLIGSERGDMGYTAYAELAEKQFAGKYFNAGEFISVTDTALKAMFSEEKTAPEEAEKCRRFAENFAAKVYSRSGIIRKVYLKLINIII